MNLYVPPFQATHIANIFQAVREHHHGERAGHLIFTKVEEVDAFASHRDAMDFAGHAPGFADMMTRLFNRQAVRDRESGDYREDNQHYRD